MRRVISLLAAGVLVVAARGAAAAPGDRARDLEIARTAYVEASPAFSAANRARALQYIDAQLPRVDAMTPEEFLLCVLAIPAFADNGHDGLNHENGAWFPTARLPVRMIWFADGWVVARAAPGLAQLLGARVLRIEGQTPDAMLARLRPFAGGTDRYRRWNVEWIIENAGLLHALGIAARPDRLTLELRLRDGRRRRSVLSFVPTDSVPPGAGPAALWTPAPWPGEAERGWRSALEGPVPLYLQDGAKRFRAVPLPELGALYVQFRSHLESAEEKLADFTRAVDAAIATSHPEHLIVDLRFDTGGNTDLTRDWIRTVPARIPGRIYLLIGPYTFSAGIVSAAAFRHDGGAKVRLVGAPVGDRLVWWSEGRDVCLPSSHYCPHLTTGQWNLERGCSGEPACYGDPYAVTVGSFEPELAAPLTAAAWLGGRDPALEAIRRELRQAPQPSR